MGRRAVEITKELILTMQPQTMLWDASYPGFVARVQTGGTVTLGYWYRSPTERLPNGRPVQRLLKLGRYVLTPKVITKGLIDDMRQKARSASGKVADGKDPQSKVQEDRSGKSMDAVFTAYEAAMDAGQVFDRRGNAKKASTIRSDKARIKTSLRPVLGGSKALAVRKSDIANQHLDGRTLGLLGSIFNWALDHGFLPETHANPVRGIRRRKDGVNERRLTADEYRKLGAHLAADKETSPYILEAVRLLCLSGWRAGDVVNLRWPNIDWKRSTVTLDDTKTRENKVRVLGAEAMELLRGIERREGSDKVFHPRHGDKIAVFSLRRVLSDAGLLMGSRAGEISVHTLRHSFGSEGSDLGITESVIYKLLGKNGLQYIHPADAKLVEAADKIAAHIAGMMR